MVDLDDIRTGIRLREAGRVDEARAHLASLWPEAEAGDDPFARCFLAHSLADVQPDPQEELRWDLVALEAAKEVSERRATEQAIPGGRLGLYPSLHLNLAESYLRVGKEAAARIHYVAGREQLHVLADDGYGQSIREAFGEYESLHPEHGTRGTS